MKHEVALSHHPLPSANIPTDIRAIHPLGRTRWASWHRLSRFLLVFTDILALAGAWQLARFLNQFYSPIPSQLIWWTWLGMPSPFWLFTAAILLLFTHYGLYSASPRARNYLKAAQLISIVYLLSLVLIYFYDPKLDPPRSLFFTAWFSSIGVLTTSRLLTHLTLRQLDRTRQSVSIFLIAPASRLRHLSQMIEKRSAYQVVGASISSMANSRATFESILKHQPDQVLAEDVPNVELASGLYWRLRSAGIPLRLLPSSREMLYRRGIPEIFTGLPTLLVETSIFQTLDYRLKRWFDFIAAGLGVVLLAPMFLIIGLAIKLTSPGPVFFRQERIGLHGKAFQIWKFRTMTADAPQQQARLENQNENKDGVLFKIRHDPRITPVGHWLRRTSLDELPQLFNVLLGQMSLVGPRPLPLRDVRQFEAWHHIRHQVLPGITGLWQISGRSDIETFDDAARLDLHYIDNWSLNLDLEILLETLRIVLFCPGAY
jgi:exopolysaccharide biosynthesis polyprenyl glycosylphosphotransferase